MMNIRIASSTDKGRLRKVNEDRHLVISSIEYVNSFNDRVKQPAGQSAALVAVADGMGGFKAGELAASLAIQAIEEQLHGIRLSTEASGKEITDFLDSIFLQAKSLILDYVKQEPDFSEMGTTLVTGFLHQDNLYISWLGDSRCYLYRKEDGLQCLTRDHSYVQMMLTAGVITAEEAFAHPFSNMIMQCLNGDPNKRAFPDHAVIAVESGDRFLFCSDGLNSMIKDAELETILQHQKDIDTCIKCCVDTANEHGGRDNITVIILDIES